MVTPATTTKKMMIQQQQQQQSRPRPRPRKRQFVPRSLLIVVALVSLTTPSCSSATEEISSKQGSCDANTDNTLNKSTNFSSRNLDHGVLEWISRQPGAYYNPKQYLEERDGLIGIFATAPIARGELLCRIPWEWTLRGEVEEDEQLSCSLVESLTKHMQLGSKSKYAPYIQYVQHQPKQVLVSSWSRPGQDLILKVLGQTREENDHDEDYRRLPPRTLARHFPPLGLASWLDEWQSNCQGNETGHQAALLVLMRADDCLIIPGYDFYNHRNGPWHNADTEILWYEAHETRARRDIQAGEQIFISYNRCLDCQARAVGYGSADMFRDYGFIEAFPQRWHYYDGNQIEFELYDRGSNHTYAVEWIHKPRSDDHAGIILEWLHEQVRRLERVWHLDYGHASFNELTAAKSGVSDFEWNMTWAFQRANLVALRAAILALPSNDPMVEVTILPRDDDAPVDILDLYHPLDNVNSWKRIDAESVRCRMHEFDEYIAIDTYSGFLQKIDISSDSIRAVPRNTCLDRNDRIHVCSSFRPTYFEYFVHPAASLLSTVKRVLIMGNGASFLLHEIMKYNATLELVMVVEPDPAVTRLSQAHFGVDPHWQDPRIQWWFGEVGAVLTRILSVESQWNSFDLVLIDLPKASFGTTFRSDMSASDLVQEKGIVVSHNNQWQEFSAMFDYTARMAYRLTPGCGDVLTMGSPSTDFIRAPAIDHGLKDTLVYEPKLMMEQENRLKLIHDWQSGVVKKDANRRQTNTTRHFEAQLGVLELVELENVRSENLEACAAKVKDALAQIGRDVLSTALLSKSNSVLLMLRDGYVSMRTPGPKGYLGLDLYLSSDPDRLPTIKAAIVESLAASTVSAYFLVSNGSIPAVVRPPKTSTSLAESSVGLGAVGDLDLSRVIKATVRKIVDTFLDQRSSVVLVVCEHFGHCLARDAILDIDSTTTVHVLEMCGHGGATDMGVQEILECERKCRDWLQSSLIDEVIFADGIILDGNLSKPSLQVLDAMVNADPPVAWGTWIPRRNVMVTLPSSSGFLSDVHRAFADRFQHTSTDVQRPKLLYQETDAVVLAEFSLSHSDIPEVEVGIVVQGQINSVATLRSLETSLSKATSQDNESVSYQAQLRHVHDGPLRTGPRSVVRQFEKQQYGSPPQVASPSGIQAFFQVQASVKELASLDAMTEKVVSALKSTDIEQIKTLTASRITNTTVFEFEDGHVILSMHGSIFALNLFYLCNGDSEADDACTTKYAHDLVGQFHEKPIDGLVVSFDVLPRGAAPNLIFSKWSPSALSYPFTPSHPQEEEEDEE